MTIININDVIIYATIKHARQKRRDGTPYIWHPLSVAILVKEGGYGLGYQTAALLHDILEDTDAKEDDLRQRFGDVVMDAVVALTRNKGEDEAHYMVRFQANKIARVVKEADKYHNLREAFQMVQKCISKDVYTEEDWEIRKFAAVYAEKAVKYGYTNLSQRICDMVWQIIPNPDDPKIQWYMDDGDESFTCVKEEGAIDADPSWIWLDGHWFRRDPVQQWEYEDMCHVSKNEIFEAIRIYKNSGSFNLPERITEPFEI